MPPEQQNALVGKYCTVCHTDATNNGGLSLQHFDAAQAAPSLTAIMLSKMTGGVSLKTARAAATDPVAAELLNRKMKSGAIGAAGLKIPDKGTIDAWIQAFAAESSRATEWTAEPAAASILREVPSAEGEARAYRLSVSCGSAQLAWAPVPRAGSLAVSADGKLPVRYPVEGSEKMGNGSGVVSSGLAAVTISLESLPRESLTIAELFPGETVVFPFKTFQAITGCGAPGHE
jgi:hypothetical protein